MTTRWWAPARALPEPDAFDLSLLEPGTDSRLDLANAVVALHRVGAAACNASRDESTLVANLVKARAAVAAPLVQSVSKSLGDGTYAGLLVRDLADDAESAALGLYRAAVARGVAPTLAAQRAGAVYGVAADGVTADYRRLATTPGTSPVAIADAADALLFSYVEKVCAQESVETVSKAGERERVRTDNSFLQALFDQAEASYGEDYLAEHNVGQDAQGRFVRERADQARQGTREAGPEPAPVRQTRQTRQTRLTRKTRTVAQTEQHAAERTSTRTAATRTSSRVPAERESQRQAMRITSRDRAEAVPAEDPSQGVEGSARWMRELDDYARHYTALPEATIFNLSQSEWVSLVNGAHGDGTPGNNRMFRVGHLEENVDAFGKPISFSAGDEDGDNLESAARKEKIDAIARLDDYEDGHVLQVPDDSQESRRKVAVDYARAQGMELDDHETQERIYDWARQVQFFNGPNSSKRGVINEGQTKVLHQVVLGTTHGQRGWDGEIELDPNQVYVLSATPTKIYDSSKHTVLYIHAARALDPQEADKELRRRRQGLGKADGYLERHNVSQGAHGHFVRERDVVREPWMDQLERMDQVQDVEPVTPTPPVRQARQTRAVRRVRQTRQVAAVEQEPSTRVSGRIAGQRESSRIRERTSGRVMSERVAQRLEQTAQQQEIGLKGNAQFHVMTDRGMTTLLENLKFDPEEGMVTLPPHLREHMRLNSRGRKSTEELLSLFVDDDIFHADHGYADGETQTVKAADLPAVIDHLFASRPHLQQIYVEEFNGEFLGAPDDALMVLRTHKQELPPTHLVAFDPGYDPDFAGELIDDGVGENRPVIWTAVKTERKTPDGRRHSVTAGYFVTRPVLHHWRIATSGQTGPRHDDDQRG